MKTTVEYKNVKFTQEGTTVICDLVSEIRYDKIKNMEFFVQMPDVLAYISNVCDGKGRMVVHTRGIAKCLPTDKFDFETGRRIAYTRAQQNVFYKASEFYDEISRRAKIDLDSTSLNCCLAGMKCGKHINDLSGLTE